MLRCGAYLCQRGGHYVTYEHAALALSKLTTRATTKVWGREGHRERWGFYLRGDEDKEIQVASFHVIIIPPGKAVLVIIYVNLPFVKNW